ncbi:unnamed protein product, partial [Urochloa humidicola]
SSSLGHNRVWVEPRRSTLEISWKEQRSSISPGACKILSLMKPSFTPWPSSADAWGAPSMVSDWMNQPLLTEQFTATLSVAKCFIPMGRRRTVGQPIRVERIAGLSHLLSMAMVKSIAYACFFPT